MEPVVVIVGVGLTILVGAGAGIRAMSSLVLLTLVYSALTDDASMTSMRCREALPSL